MSHTPGPWTMSLYPDIDGYKIIGGSLAFNGGNPAVIAIVKNQETRQIGECQANAELLLSAPDLLAQAQRDAAVIAEMKAGLLHLAYIMSETAGIAGWHLNGELLTWEEFAVGNDIMRTAIAAAESRAEAKPEPEKRCDGCCWTRSFDGEPCAECRESIAAGPEVRG